MCMRPANGKLRYIEKSSLIDWAHAPNDPCGYTYFVRQALWYSAYNLKKWHAKI